MTAQQILDREFLEIRGKILEIAASLDRLDRAEGDIQGDRRVRLVHDAIAILESPEKDRAEQVQRLFSRQYQSDWRDAFDLSAGRKAK